MAHHHDHHSAALDAASALLSLAIEARLLRSAIVRDMPPGPTRARLAHAAFATVAQANGATNGLVRLALDHDDDFAELLRLAHLGLSEREPTLLAFLRSNPEEQAFDNHHHHQLNTNKEWTH